MFAAIRQWVYGARNLASCTSITEATEVSGLSFEVEKVPAYQAIDRGASFGGDTNIRDVSYKQARDAFLVRRTDNDDVLGLVGKRYATVQNSAVLDAIRPLFDQGLVTPESGGAFDGGSTGFMAFQMDVEKINKMSNGQTEELFGEVQPFFLVQLSHDGSGSNRVIQIPQRIQCTNQLPGMNVTSAIAIRHTGAAQEKMEEQALKLFGGLADQYVAFAQTYNLLRFKQLSEAAFEKMVVDVAFPLSKPPVAPTTRWTNERTRQLDRRELVRKNWTDGTGHRGDHSAWEALNGVIECMDHEELFNRRGSNVKSNVQGARVRTKNRLLAGLVRYASN